MANDGHNASNFIADFKTAADRLTKTGRSASEAIANFSSASMAMRQAGFPAPDAVLDRAMAMEHALEQLGAANGPPDEIVELGHRRGDELGVPVDFIRTIEPDGSVCWWVQVHTKRGIAHASPHATDKELRELAFDLLPVAAWKNALREVGLL